MSYVPINWGLIAHPVNWVTIVLMVVIPLMAIDSIIRSAKQGA